MRRCLFCHQLGDREECDAGRLLYAGLNEWVHINCALWSAEVYEDQDGRLKHVHDALKRGNKIVSSLLNITSLTLFGPGYFGVGKDRGVDSPRPNIS